jgi:hypothetical protein
MGEMEVIVKVLVNNGVKIRTILRLNSASISRLNRPVNNL